MFVFIIIMTQSGSFYKIHIRTDVTFRIYWPLDGDQSLHVSSLGASSRVEPHSAALDMR